jgi:uncharacterized protein
MQRPTPIGKSTREGRRSNAMRSLLPAMKLTVFVGGDERQAHRALYHEVLELLLDEGIAGATLTRGVMSFGHHRSIHSVLNEITMDNLPIVIEAVDQTATIERAATRVAALIGERGLVTMQPTMIAQPLAVNDQGDKARC